MHTNCRHRVNSTWLLHSLKVRQQGSRQRFIYLTAFLTISVFPSFTLSTERSSDANFASCAIFSGSLAFACFTLAALSLSWSATLEEDVIVALTFERELNRWRAASRNGLDSAAPPPWQLPPCLVAQNNTAGDVYGEKSFSLAPDQLSQEAQPDAQHHPFLAKGGYRQLVNIRAGDPSARGIWVQCTEPSVTSQRRQSFWLNLIGRVLTGLGLVFLLAALIFVAQFKISHVSSNGSLRQHLSITLTTILSLVAVVVVGSFILVVQQAFYGAMWAPCA